MTNRQFDAILRELGLTRAAAARALGVSLRTVTIYANSKGPVPRRVELMIKGLVAERGEAEAAKGKRR